MVRLIISHPDKFSDYEQWNLFDYIKCRHRNISAEFLNDRVPHVIVSDAVNIFMAFESDPRVNNL